MHLAQRHAKLAGHMQGDVGENGMPLSERRPGRCQAIIVELLRRNVPENICPAIRGPTGDATQSHGAVEPRCGQQTQHGAVRVLSLRIGGQVPVDDLPLTLPVGSRLPKTIDNDLEGTVMTFGFDSAVACATDALDRLHTTAESHNRVMVLEVMGPYAGWIALYAGVAGGADVILIPEIPFSYESICRRSAAKFSFAAFFDRLGSDTFGHRPWSSRNYRHEDPTV